MCSTPTKDKNSISEEDEKGREVTVSGAPKARVVTKHMTVWKIKNGQPEK
jgi:hypothetical protein